MVNHILTLIFNILAIFTPATFETPELGSRETPKVNKKSKEFDDSESSEEEEPFANR